MQVKATHLVGGDFELKHQQGNQYRLLLNLYFDEINGRPSARDQSITAKIYEKATNKEMAEVYMPLRTQTNLNYANPECTTNLLRTSRIIYYADLALDPAIYNHPGGYYVVWERCCRNGIINNIEDPQGAGQAYYMEFPAVTRNGQAFKNSSPVLSPPISDYACINEEFSYDFGATDPDGDVVTYELATPLNGHTHNRNANGQANPAPYDEIRWLPGYSLETQVPGNPALAIDRTTGRLTVTPDVKGLFVFSIRYEEFRNGVKIGEVRRDFQMLVNDCPRNEEPTIKAKSPGSTAMYQEGQVINISRTGPRCFTLYLTDTDANERLAVSAVPVNFNQKGFALSGQTSGRINSTSRKDTLVANLCFERCFDSGGKVFLVDVIVSDFGDNGCGLPKRDTVRVSVVVDPAPDLPPAISFSDPRRVYELYDGDILAFDVTGTDPDNDPVELSLAGQGFTASGQSIQFSPTRANGRVTTPFRWQIDCKATAAPVYQLEFAVTSFICGEEVKRTEMVEVRILKRALLNNTIAGAQVICYNDVPATLQGSQPTGGNNSFSYRWEVSTTDGKSGFGTTSGTNRDFSPPALIQTSWFRRIAMSGSCNEIADTSQTVKILVNPLPELPAVKDAIVCPGATALLQASSTEKDLVFTWYDQPTGGNLLHTGTAYQTVSLTESALYYVEVTNGNGCVSATRKEVKAGVYQSTADAGPDVTIIKGRSAELKGKGGTGFLWSASRGSIPNPAIRNPVVMPDTTTTYVLKVTTGAGCVFTDTMTVTVLRNIRPADAITLNNDGRNEDWYIEHIEDYPSSVIQVFTRWGAKVFESRGYKIRWDGTDNGKELPMAAYYYIIRLDEKEKPITGSITLIK